MLQLCLVTVFFVFFGNYVLRMILLQLCLLGDNVAAIVCVWGQCCCNCVCLGTMLLQLCVWGQCCCNCVFGDNVAVTVCVWGQCCCNCVCLVV